MSEVWLGTVTSRSSFVSAGDLRFEGARVRWTCTTGRLALSGAAGLVMACALCYLALTFLECLNHVNFADDRLARPDPRCGL